MARFVRKPRPTHQQRRSHHGHEAAETAEATGEEMSEEPVTEDVVEAGESVEQVVAEEVPRSATTEVPAEDVSGESEPPGELVVATDAGDSVAAQGEAEAPVAVAPAPAIEPAIDGGEESDIGEGPEAAADVGEVAAAAVTEEAGADAGDAEEAGADAGDADAEGAGERRTIKRRRRRRSPAGATTDAVDGGADDGEATVDGDVAPEPQAPAPVASGSPAADDADRDERKRMQMLIHVEGDRVQVSVLEGRSLVEHYVADRTSQSLAGNIYLGKVQNVLPGMEAAFIDIGTPKNAVLYAGDVRFIADEFEMKTPRIEDILEVGQSVLVQVVKDPMGSKGARLTTEISLPGRFLVLVPESDSTGISRRLAESERERLRDVLRRIRPDGFGVIVRTAAEYTSEDKLTLDMQRLEALWKEVYLEATRANPPELVYEEPDLVIRTVREIFSGEFRRLIVDDKEVYDKICEYLGDYEPDLLQRIQLYQDEMSLYRRYHVSEQLRQGLSRKVWLPSGGSLVFDSAEALTVIDVNTSKNVGKNSLEETVFQNNLEAAEEIGRQLRLRDIGGIIVIDFIDMETAKNRQAVLRSFREAVSRDKTKTQVYDISELGLVEMTRKNVSEGLISAFSHACAECSGRGLIVDEDF